MTEITPEKVAAAACDTVNRWRHSLQGALSLTAVGNVLNLEVTRWAEDDTETVRHFRAPVVEGEDPVVVASPELLAAARALYRAHVKEGSESADQAAHTRYEVAAALYALTPEQVAVLAGDDEQGGV
jgi:hypothetical protein